MAICFGLHIGNTGMCLSLLRDGSVNVIANDIGDRITPAVLSVVHEDEILVGVPAKQGIVRNRTATIVNNKQFMEPTLSESDFDQYSTVCVCPISHDSGKVIHKITKDDLEMELAPKDVLRHFMKYMFSMAQNSMQIVLEKLSVVISVPVWSDLETRNCIREVAEEIGFDVLHLISEPTAVAIAYELDSNPETNTPEYYIIYRAGGLSSDITVLENREGMLSIVSNKHVNEKKASGNELTRIMVQYLAKEFYNKYKLDPMESRNAINKLTYNAEQCKHILSTMPTAQIFIDSLMDGVDWESKMTRARFEHLIQATCQLYINELDACFEELKGRNIEESQISKVILCGGTAKIPYLQQMFRKRLQPEIELLTHLCGDEVISMGCAHHGKAITSLKHFDATMDIERELKTLLKGISISRKDETVVTFDQGALLPASKKFTLSVEEEEHDIDFKIVLVDDSSADLGTVKLNVDKSTGSEVNCVAQLKENGALAITVHA